MRENEPRQWLSSYPFKTGEGHKYDFGVAAIYAAPQMTGATRMAAQACSRIGAGLVNVLCPKSSLLVYQTTLPANIIVRGDLDWWDERITARLYGCGGLPRPIDTSKTIPTVLDADALSHLPNRLNSHTILTPHEGEFAKAFPYLSGSRQERAEQAARQSGAIIVLKGAETIIACAGRETVVNRHASPLLATGGTGDILAGMITGLCAQGMAPFEAACAGVWLHGDAARKAKGSLVATDLVDLLKLSLADLSASD